MKLTTILLFALIIQVRASSYAQKTITINERNATLEKVLEKIGEQSGYDIFFNSQLIEKANQVSIKVKDMPLLEVLKKCFANQPLIYTVEGSAIIIKDKNNLQKNPSPKAPLGTVKGKVVDEKNEGLAGVTVRVKATATTMITDSKGYFEGKNINEDAILQVSFIGYATQEIKVDFKSEMLIQLVPELGDLNEVVVVGFGKQKKASIVGAISTISAKDLKVPTSSLSNAFAGRIAGVIAVQRGGEPGADGSNFWIRGISTFAGPSNPLIFIDGVEASSADMNALPAEVIDNFSVLKDASATALYGARGANGVMLITTKRGSDLDKPIINFRIENTFSAPTQMVKMADGVDYMNAFNYAILNRNPTATPRFTQEKIQGTIDKLDPILYPNVDWQDYLFKKFSANQYANLNVKGGSKKADYFISANFNNNNGMLKNDAKNEFNSNINEKQYNLIANVGVNLTENTKVVLRLNSRMEDYGGTAQTTANVYNSIFTAAPALFAPVLPAQNNENYTLFGNLNGGPLPDASGSNIYRNPYAYMVSGYNKRFTSTNTASLDATQDLKFLLKGLSLKGLLSFRNYTRTIITRNFTPYYYEVNGANTDGSYLYKSVSRGNQSLSTTSTNPGDRLMNLNFVLDWLRSYGNHDVSAMATYLSREATDNSPGANFRTSLPVRNQGVAGRVTYGYKSKYFFEGNFGYNGSENFADGQRFGFFPSLAAGYLISNEKFWKPLSNVINSLKIRGSWGIVGNAAVYGTDGAVKFPYLDNVALTGKSFTFGDNWQTTASGAYITTLGAPNARWEEGRKANIGLDLTLFNKLTINADIYREIRKDIFMARQVVPAETGILPSNSPYANLGKVRAEGFEVNLSYNHQINKDFYINLRGTLTYAKNTLIDRDEPELPNAYLSRLGQPLNSQFGLIADGYFKDDQDILNSPKSSYNAVLLPGDIKYKDLNNDGVINDNDRTTIGTPYVPQIVYGFGAQTQYKKIDFSFFFQGAGKSSIMMSNILPFNSDQSTLFDFIAKDYWTPENTDAAFPRLISNISNHNNFQASTFWLRDVTFVRLKNVELGYTYRNGRVYFSGQNLLTFSDFKLWDPEIGSANGLTYPNLKVFSVGLQLNF